LGGLAVGLLLAFAYDYAARLRPGAQRLAVVAGSSVAILVVLAILVKAFPPEHTLLLFG
jgi:uncharacterized membrane protein